MSDLPSLIFFSWFSNSNYSNLPEDQFFLHIIWRRGVLWGWGYVLWRHKISTLGIDLVVRIERILKREILKTKKFFFPWQFSGFFSFYVPFARHYNPRFVFILPHFSLRFIFESGLYCREVSNYMNLFSSKVAIKIE